MNDLPDLTLDRWCEVIQNEYLNDYVRSGGAAVKVLTGSDAVLSQAVNRLRTASSESGYYYAHLDTGQRDTNDKRPDLHRIDRFFFAATHDVDWKKWVAMQVRRYLENSGIYLAEGRSMDDLEGIALDNGRDPQDLINQYQREFSTPQIRDTQLAMEFRAAITALGRSLLMSDAVTPTTEEVLLGWFAGRSVPGAASALKKVQVFERINLGNARSMLTSFCRWLPHTGHGGLVVTLDVRPYEYKKIAKGKRLAEQLQQLRDAMARGASASELEALAAEHGAAEPDVVYSDAAYLQMLTTIRRFIDEIDGIERLLLVILTTPDFYKDKLLHPEVKRSYFDYDALQTRIGQEVHDARFSNPAAALAHLGELS